MRRNPSLARKLVANLPQSSWLKKNDNMLTGDFDKFGDAGVTDLLLHHCDHAFRVPEVRGSSGFDASACGVFRPVGFS